MKLPKELTTVTRVSKVVALTMFVLLPIIGFMFGMNYKSMLEQSKSYDMFPEANAEYSCELDVTVCPDNSLVGRVPPVCEYAPCE